MKLIETINNTAIELMNDMRSVREWLRNPGQFEECIRQLREYSKEAYRRDESRQAGVKRIAELETEVRKLTEVNHSAAAELNRARADAESMRLEVERLQSEVARLSAPGAGDSAITEPDPGEWFELCEKYKATDYTCRASAGWCNWYPMIGYRGVKGTDYRFRRPIAKPESRWVACTAEEAYANYAVSQVLVGPDWQECGKPIPGYGFHPGNHYRTTATLPLEVAVPKSVWDRAPAEARHKTYADGGEPVYLLVRSRLPDGFRLDAP